MKRTIYGLYDRNGICFYIGQTSNPMKRARQHRCKWPNLSFRILRECRPESALRIERQVTLAYQRRNQCIMPGYRFQIMPLIKSNNPNREHKELAELLVF